MSRLSPTLLLLAFALACKPAPTAPESAPAPAAATGAAAATASKAGGRALTDADARAGKATYLRECSACHGERGDGNGPAAAFLDPRPRDFTKRMFKLRTTASGQPPATADVLKVLANGIPGSAMPAFNFLSPDERRQVAAYVLDRADFLDGPEPKPIEAGAAPAATAASVARGKQIYEAQGCGACHGALGRGDGASAAQLRDDDGRPIAVRDFTGGVYRGGGAREDLWYRFVTGMDGTPMPSFADSVKGEDRWALVDYVKSLQTPPKAAPTPADPIAAARPVIEKRGCRGCHVLDDGKGGPVGPDLRVSAQKLSPEWVRAFLRAPRDVGKIYPWRLHRMPDLHLSADEVETLARYLVAIGKRKDAPLALPDPSTFAKAKVDEGNLLFMLRCTECHQLGKVIETPPIKQQGPDLINVAKRVDYAFAKRWILDPKKVDPSTRMTVPGITADQVEAVRMFVWKASMEEAAKAGKLTSR
jgi:cytochrome c oxidase cbb3-type subunit 2